jgi:hypothetical protein
MQRLALPGLIALGFGLASWYATGETSLFGRVNLMAGAAALVLAAIGALQAAGGLASRAAWRILAPRLAACLLAVAAAVAAERAAARTGWRLDWTVDGSFELFPATKLALAALPAELDATLYHDRGDPRARRTRLLLETLAREGPVRVRVRDLEQSGEDADRFEIRGTNAVVLELRGAYETVDRPTEGSLLEAILRLRGGSSHKLYSTVGEGEGDPASPEPTGYSGLAVALGTEGYALEGLVTATGAEIPDDAGALLVIGAQRALRPEAVNAIERYLQRGGRLVALLEPGVRSGLEELLERWGFAVPDGVVIDPLAGPIEGGAAGGDALGRAYASHPITRGLDPRTLTFFPRARPVEAVRKPEPEDQLTSLVFTSPRSWLDTDVAAVRRGVTPVPPEGTELRRWPIAAAGRYSRAGGEARIVVLGDADFADNLHLRTLYNVDLWMNAVHWALAREDAITLRPKVMTPDQDPLTPQQTLGMLYGVGLLIPELMLVAAAVAWMRRRGA